MTATPNASGCEDAEVVLWYSRVAITTCTWNHGFCPALQAWRPRIGGIEVRAKLRTRCRRLFRRARGSFWTPAMLRRKVAQLKAAADPCWSTSVSALTRTPRL